MMNLLLIIVFSLFISVDVLATELNISLSHKVTEGNVYFQGKTNLPSNTKIGINLTSSSSYYSAQDYDIFVKSDGSFVSAGFSNKGKPLSGDYTAKVISYANKFWQNADILTKIKNYTGYGIENGNMLIIYNFSIDSSEGENSSPVGKKRPGEYKEYDVGVCR